MIYDDLAKAKKDAQTKALYVLSGNDLRELSALGLVIISNTALEKMIDALEIEESPSVWESNRLLAEQPVTLNGKPAYILGVKKRFATVSNGECKVEFAWATVAQIIANGGEFQS